MKPSLEAGGPELLKEFRQFPSNPDLCFGKIPATFSRDFYSFSPQGSEPPCDGRLHRGHPAFPAIPDPTMSSA